MCALLRIEPKDFWNLYGVTRENERLIGFPWLEDSSINDMAKLNSEDLYFFDPDVWEDSRFPGRDLLKGILLPMLKVKALLEGEDSLPEEVKSYPKFCYDMAVLCGGYGDGDGFKFWFSKLRKLEGNIYSDDFRRAMGDAQSLQRKLNAS